jgi:hypothetical protein
MKRIASVLALAALVALASSAIIQAAPQAKRHATTRGHVYAHNGMTCPVSDPSQCSGSCPRTGVAAAASKHTVSVRSVDHAACPASDPSKCPASCRRSGAAATTATAVNVQK